MNDMFDELKAIKSKMKKDEAPSKSVKPKKSKTKEMLIKEKEDELKADFLEYMSSSEVKKLDA